MMPDRMIHRDIVIPQGKYWEWPLRLLDGDGELVDTTSWSARMQIRADYADTGSPVIVDLTKANGRVQTGILPRTPLAINTLLTMTDTVTGALTDWGQGVYEVEIIDDSGRVLDYGFYGTATLRREVVR